jgi:hypothetical protein
MKVKGESYKKKVIVPKVWEEILDKKGEKQRVLVTTTVSQYIRSLESKISNGKIST